MPSVYYYIKIWYILYCKKKKTVRIYIIEYDKNLKKQNKTAAVFITANLHFNLYIYSTTYYPYRLPE
jgi:hypothetical protein